VVLADTTATLAVAADCNGATAQCSRDRWWTPTVSTRPCPGCSLVAYQRPWNPSR